MTSVVKARTRPRDVEAIQYKPGKDCNCAEVEQLAFSITRATFSGAVSAELWQSLCSTCGCGLVKGHSVTPIPEGWWIVLDDVEWVMSPERFAAEYEVTE